MKTANKIGTRSSLKFLKFNYLTARGILVIVILLSLFQLYVSNRFVTEGQSIKEAEAQTEMLKSENLKIQNQIEGLSSLRNIQTQASKMGFVKIDKVRYLAEPVIVASR